MYVGKSGKGKCMAHLPQKNGRGIGVAALRRNVQRRPVRARLVEQRSLRDAVNLDLRHVIAKCDQAPEVVHLLATAQRQRAVQRDSARGTNEERRRETERSAARAHEARVSV